MLPSRAALCVALLVAALILIVALLAYHLRGPAGGRGRQKDGYLIYPYLDLDEPGERGSYYALSEGC